MAIRDKTIHQYRNVLPRSILAQSPQRVIAPLNVAFFPEFGEPSAWTTVGQYHDRVRDEARWKFAPGEESSVRRIIEGACDDGVLFMFDLSQG
jgi:hypothetical protein